MSYLTQSILLGLGNFPFFAVLFTVPIFFAQVCKYKKINFARIGLNYLFLMYSLCLIALVLFPLPTPEQAANLTYRIQLIPFHFISDIIRESPLVWYNPLTFLPAMFQKAVLQVIFNVIMTVPFGMYLRYYYKFSCRKIVLFSLALSLVIEFAQFSGLFFIYHGSYRLCDVDDLMCNTLGGFLGYVLISLAEKKIPAIQAFDLRLPKVFASHHAAKLS